jgi:hypothetical protein
LCPLWPSPARHVHARPWRRQGNEPNSTAKQKKRDITSRHDRLKNSPRIFTLLRYISELTTIMNINRVYEERSVNG